MIRAILGLLGITLVGAGSLQLSAQKPSVSAPTAAAQSVPAPAYAPTGAPRPDDGSRDSFATYLETELDRAAAAHPNPGRPATLHRLNRAEYTNAIRDLLAVDIDAASLLPADDASYGFDDIGDMLTDLPVLMEGYMSAAPKISMNPTIPVLTCVGDGRGGQV